MPRKRGNDLTTRKKRQDIEKKQTNQFNFLSKHKKLELFEVKFESKRYEFNVGERKEKDLVRVI